MKYQQKLKLIKKLFSDKIKKSKKFGYPLLTDGYSPSDLREATKVLISGRITMSNITKKFENYFAKKIGSKYALMVNSGSSANLLALYCLINPYRKKKFKKRRRVFGASFMLVDIFMACCSNRSKTCFCGCKFKNFHIGP